MNPIFFAPISSLPAHSLTVYGPSLELRLELLSHNDKAGDQACSAIPR